MLLKANFCSREGKEEPCNMLLLLLLRRFSCVRLCATPQTAAHPGSSVPGILQARTLEWVAMHAYMLSCFSCVHPYGQQPTRLLCPWDSPGKNPGIKPTSPASPAFAGRFFTTEPPGKPLLTIGAASGFVVGASCAL